MGTYLVTALDGLAFGMLLFTVAAGLVLIYGVMGELNLAHGSLYLLGAGITAVLNPGSLSVLGLALAVGLVAGAGGGAGLAGLLRPLTGGDRHLDQAMITLGLAFLAADAYVTVFGATPLPVAAPTALDGTWRLGPYGYPAYRMVFIAVAAGLAIGLHLVVRRARAGIMLRATVADPGMAAATGIPTTRVRTWAFACGGMLAVAGGVLGAPILGPAPNVDTQVLVWSLIIVVVGGAGSVPATLTAALLVGQVQTLGVITAPALAPFALFTVVVAVLVLRRPPGARTA